MILAAFETSSRPGSVALWSPAGLRSAPLADARRHASDLLPTLQRLLDEAGLGPRDLQAVCLGTGPGSYTGLRVGVATALGLAHATGARLRAVPSLEALALRLAPPGDELAIALDARAEGYYYARYRRSADATADEVEALDGPDVLSRDALLAHLSRGTAVVADEGVRALAAAAGLPDAPFLTACAPDAECVARLGRTYLARHRPSTPTDCEPLYLRPFAVRRARGR